jgi:glycerol-3-phosphate dehydrogenase
VGTAGRLSDLGAEIVPGLFEAEARYLVDAEWARSAEDILWRRTKLGLHLPVDAAQCIDDWLAADLRPGRRRMS